MGVRANLAGGADAPGLLRPCLEAAIPWVAGLRWVMETLNGWLLGEKADSVFLVRSMVNVDTQQGLPSLGVRVGKTGLGGGG